MTREEKFRKKPAVIDAFQFTNQSKDMVWRWASSQQMNIQPSFDKDGKPILLIPTLEGEMICRIGDWIIRGVNGEFYPCKPDIFEKTYEPATPLPPAEGAEEITATSYIRNTWGEAWLRNMWEAGDVISALGEFATLQNKPQPTAEGAEEINKMIGQTKDSISKRYNKNYWEILGDYHSNGRLTTNDFIDELLTEFAAQQQPTAEGAEEILQKYMDMSMIICPLHVVPRTVALDAMHEFATLHAQKIADKMVNERYADTEADGYVFCGKCGKMKEI